jgi:hypothetical protein
VRFLFAILFAVTAEGQQPIRLTWTAPPDPRVAGYNVYYGVASRAYTNKVLVARTNAAVVQLASGVKYYFAATAVTTNGIESDFSNEVSTIVKPSAPTMLNNTVTLWWGAGPFTVWESTNLIAWTAAATTPFNFAEFPRDLAGSGGRFYFVTDSQTNKQHITIQLTP